MKSDHGRATANARSLTSDVFKELTKGSVRGVLVMAYATDEGRKIILGGAYPRYERSLFRRVGMEYRVTGAATSHLIKFWDILPLDERVL